MALYNLWKRFSSRKESVYTPARAEVKMLTEEERLQFLEYACIPKNLVDCGRVNSWFWEYFFPPEPYVSVWQCFVEIVPAQPKDTRYLPILLNLWRYGLGYLSALQQVWDKRPLRSENVQVLSAPLCFYLSSLAKDEREALPSETRKMLLELLASPYEDIELTLAILEVVPFLYDEGFLPRLNVLLMGDKFSPERRQVVEVADRAYRCLMKNIKTKKENDTLLRPALVPDEANSLLRPAHDPIETKPKELLRPAEKQERNEL